MRCLFMVLLCFVSFPWQVWLWYLIKILRLLQWFRHRRHQLVPCWLPLGATCWHRHGHLIQTSSSNHIVTTKVSGASTDVSRGSVESIVGRGQCNAAHAIATIDDKSSLDFREREFFCSKCDGCMACCGRLVEGVGLCLATLRSLESSDTPRGCCGERGESSATLLQCRRETFDLMSHSFT